MEIDFYLSTLSANERENITETILAVFDRVDALKEQGRSKDALAIMQEWR